MVVPSSSLDRTEVGGVDKVAVNFVSPSGNTESLMAELAQISSRGNYNVPMRLPKPKPPAALRGFEGLPPGLGTGSGVTPGTGPSGALPGGDLGLLMAAIKGKESSGDYGAVNRDSGAMGAYQIMPSNIFANNGSDWDRQALGRDVSREEFMSSPGIQDAIAKYKLGLYLKSRGMAGAAATWYGGDWGYNHMHDRKPQAGYPSMYDYVMAILNAAGRG